MKIYLLTPALSVDDAVGTNIIHEYSVLRDHGYQAKLYATHCDDSFKSHLIDKRALERSIQEEDALILYHHSIYWEEGEYLLRTAKCRVVLRYHNITPNDFFKQYSDFYRDLVIKAREQTIVFTKCGKINHYIADSEFNAEELIAQGVPKSDITVIAPFHRIADFESLHVNLHLLETLLDGKINVLSVSRIVPNKGLHHALLTVERYVDYYGPDIRFNIVGGVDSYLMNYFNELSDSVNQKGLSSFIQFQGKVNIVDLHTFYLASHVYLLLSEHEGFCLPILEAQYHKLPVIALERGAVKKTIGEQQLVSKDLDYDFFAAAIQVVARNNDYRNYLADAGYRNYSKYLIPALSDQFMRIIDGIKR